MKIKLLMTGDELMSGDIVDSNAAAIAQRFSELGWIITEKATVGDALDALAAQIRRLSADSDLLLINGGLGPTVDDLTAAALAAAVGRPLREHPQALAHLQSWCEQRLLQLNNANRKQAWLPEGADIIPNAVGTAVGFALTLGNCLVMCTPGVPSELLAMLDTDIVPTLRQRFPTGDARTVKLQTFGLGESSLQQRFNDQFADWPRDIVLGFRAGLPLLEIKLSIADSRHEQLLHAWREKIAASLGDYLLHHDDIATEVVDLLRRRQLTLTTAESCTGGLIAANITAVAGASAVFAAGFVAYADHIKQSVLGVTTDALRQHGAVSATVAMQMAAGALQKSGSDYAIAVSGIAGPTGGSADKPVGTVWLAWGDATQLQSVALCIPGSRQFFQKIVAAIGLDLIRRQLCGIHAEPAYFKRWRPPTSH